MIESLGELEFPADDANIPVNIFIEEVDAKGCALPEETTITDFEVTGQKYWRLTADNFMPRRTTINQDAYQYVATTREELNDLVKREILPLYQVALDLVKDMSEGKQNLLYYWHEQDWLQE